MGDRAAARDDRTEPDRPGRDRCVRAPPRRWRSSAGRRRRSPRPTPRPPIAAAHRRARARSPRRAGARRGRGASPATSRALAEAVSAYEAAVAALARRGRRRPTGATLGARATASPRGGSRSCGCSPRSRRSAARPVPAARHAPATGRSARRGRRRWWTGSSPALQERGRGARRRARGAARRRGASQAEGGRRASRRRWRGSRGARARSRRRWRRPSPPPEGPEVSALTMMARDSESLTALAAALARTGDAPAPPAAPRTGRCSGRSAGAVLRHFDEPDAAGVRRPGHRRRGAAARDGQRAGRRGRPLRRAVPRVRLRGSCSSPTPRRWSCSPGLAQLQVRTGATVRRGELLGLIGGRRSDVEENVMLPDPDTATGPGETLYIEVRQGRGPVDPEPLFQGENG